MSYHFENVRLEKGMYGRSGTSFWRSWTPASGTGARLWRDWMPFSGS